MMVVKRISLLILIGFAGLLAKAQSPFVNRRGGHFFLNGAPYYYIGANYWYGGLLANSVEGRRRVKRELDFLAARHVSNLRVMAGAEGSGAINGVTRVGPALQPEQGRFNPDLLEGLDFLLSEMGKRGMKAVVFLSNNWEWSGGFLQYLNWNGLLPDSILPRKLTWDEQRDYVSAFYSCGPCRQQYNGQVALVINRVNTITKKRYRDDPAIMAWEIANEPRPMRPAAIAAFEKWISATAAYIKQLDPHHLVTTGSEGEMGSETMDVFQAIHTDVNIDYCTIHIWPKNWGWFKDTAIAKDLGHVIDQTNNYIKRHAAVARQLGKPLVIEEFGLPRDGHSYLPTSATSLRNRYYAGIFNQWKISKRMNDIIGGCNFWAFSGSGRPARGRTGWQAGDDLLGDPPQEEQGLNAVFDSDTATWQLIESF
ncbi:MAG TPA: cellulase family glycosylhydrolase, partial [Chitinophagaceae bacterium]|nr:cellulase family glycosylhydrolase [Chitinophagaceae bacterium]